jgi:hypothetical protein
MRIVVPKINSATDNPECLIGDENFLLTRGYHKKVAVTVRRQIKREI